MSKRDQYPPGVPCFVDTLTPDLDAAMRFYGGVFGWQFDGPGAIPTDPPGQYFVARLRDHDVAGIGSRPPANGSAPLPGWSTYVAVASADDAAARAAAAGGNVIVEPFDAPPAGRMAVIADPGGAQFCVWEAGTRQGAELVNEPSAWAMSALNTTDPEAAKSFYGELFGWQAEPMPVGPGIEIWLWRLPDYFGGEPSQPVPRDVVAAMIKLGPESGGQRSNWSVDFWTDDADAAAAAARSLGGTVVAEPFVDATFRRTVLADPDGAVFSASQLQLPA